MSLDFKKVKEAIELFGWYPFGEKQWVCPGPNDNYLDEYYKTNKLPSPCDKCFKSIIFWESDFSEENLIKIFKLIDSCVKECRGKLNETATVFYFREKQEMLKFLGDLKEKMNEFDLDGRISWRRACKAYRDRKPELWIDGKTFIPDTV